MDATVSMKVTKPDGTVDTIPMTLTGSGIYSGAFTRTTVGGSYKFNVSATGTLSGAPEPYNRQYQQSVFVSVPFKTTSVLLATNSMVLRNGTTVTSGDIVVNNKKTTPGVSADGYDLELKEGTSTPAGYAVKAPSITVRKKAEVEGDVYSNTLDDKAGIGATQLHSPVTLPIISSLPVFRSATPGTDDVTVRKNKTVTLDPGAYRNVSIQGGGALVLSGGEYHFNSLSGSNRATLTFLKTSTVHVQTTVVFGGQPYIGPAANTSMAGADMIFYVGGSEVTLGTKADVSANFFAPFASVTLKQGSEFKGSIIGRDIVIDQGGHVTLSSYFLAHPDIPGGKAANQEPKESNLPKTFGLDQNYPNPFNPTTTISYQLAEQRDVRLVIFNILGQVVKTLVDGVQPAGFYTVRWDGRNNEGMRVSSGMYFYRLKAGNTFMTKKMLLLK